jgi:Fe2+ transport system protein B
MAIDPEVKKILDLKFVSGEINENEYKGRLKVLSGMDGANDNNIENYEKLNNHLNVSEREYGKNLSILNDNKENQAIKKDNEFSSKEIKAETTKEEEEKLSKEKLKEKKQIIEKILKEKNLESSIQIKTGIVVVLIVIVTSWSWKDPHYYKTVVFFMFVSFIYFDFKRSKMYSNLFKILNETTNEKDLDTIFGDFI